MSIHLIIGPPRMGKTCFAAMLAIQYCDANDKLPAHERREVWANFPIYDDRIKQFNTYTELQELRNCIAFVDEASGWFGRRSYTKTSDDDLMFWRQHGHDGLTLFLCAHHLNDLETKIAAELALTIYDVRRLWGPSLMEGPTPIERRLGWWARVRRFDARTFLSITKQAQLERTRYFRIERQFHKFDSFYVVGDRDGRGRREGGAHLARNAAVRAALPLVNADVYSQCRIVDAGGRVIVRPNPAVLNDVQALIVPPMPQPAVAHPARVWKIGRYHNG